MYLDIMNKFADSNQDFKIIFTASLTEYFKALVQNEKQLAQVSSTITDLCHRSVVIYKDKLKRLLRIKRVFYLRSHLYLRMRKWRLATFKLAMSTYRNTDGWLNKTTIVSARTKKEIEELKECTFQPAVNTSTSTRNSRYKTNNSILIDRNLNNLSVYARLYSDYMRINLKKEIKRNETEVQLGESTSFLPKMSHTPKQYQSLSSRSFSERIVNYKENKQKRREKLENQIEDSYRMQYTFVPITNKRSAFSLVKSQHVYGHAKKKSDDDVYLNNQKDKRYRPLDVKRIESLYLSYKERKNKIRHIQTETDKENGYTYQPTLLSIEDDKYKQRIDKNVIERNEQFIQNKKENISKASQSHYSYQQPKISYTFEEKKQITQNIINRLYSSGVQKTLTRNCKDFRVLHPKGNKYLPTTSSQIQDNEKILLTNEEYHDRMISLEDYQNRKVK